MSEAISYIHRDRTQNAAILPDWLSTMATSKARAFHASMPGYRPTPLVDLAALASHLGVGRILVKDESQRFGLNAFKALGGSYAIARILGDRYGLQDLSFEQLSCLQSEPLTFVTATDGNHGRGVAWAASKFGQRAVVYLPKGSAKSRVEAIRALGAEADVLDHNYDEAVRYAARQADRNGWVLVQDTGWQGYEQIPAWIMQGYLTMADEAWEQLEVLRAAKPSHVFLQAGVGSMAGAVLGFFRNRLGNNLHASIMEPATAACVYRSVVIGDEEPHTVSGDLQTIMAGLACGEPNPLAWPILRDCASTWFSCPDYLAALGMRILGRPLAGDVAVIAGESGAIGVGLLAVLMQASEFTHLRQQMQLGPGSTVLIINTEGATDPENYLDVVWRGKYSLPLTLELVGEAR